MPNPAKWTLFENFEGFSQLLKEQSDKKIYLDVFTHSIAIIKKHENRRNLKKIKCPIVIDYADTQFLNFKIKYLQENEKVCKTVFPCL